MPVPDNLTKWWDGDYLAVYERLADAAGAAAGGRPLWLTETDSVNHHGIPGLTDAFGNSLWLARRLGAAAARGDAMVSRQRRSARQLWMRISLTRRPSRKSVLLAARARVKASATRARVGSAVERTATAEHRSLVGFDYALLGANASALAPAPDYFLTLLFRKLVGGVALSTTSVDGLAAYASGSVRI